MKLSRAAFARPTPFTIATTAPKLKIEASKTTGAITVSSSVVSRNNRTRYHTLRNEIFPSCPSFASVLPESKSFSGAAVEDCTREYDRCPDR